MKSIESCPISNECADTIYLGGGTPSLLNGGQMQRILSAVNKKFPFTSQCEITSEANPGTVTAEFLKSYKSAGINRLSYGVQSCKDNELYILGRIHTFNEVRDAFDLAEKAGFENISADIMLGIPYQTRESAMESIEKISSLGPRHISAYMLKIEAGTRFDTPEIRALIPDDDTVCDIYLDAVKALSQRGFKQYEISNFAVPEYESLHNLKYWTGKPYLGFGPSAHSYFGGRRFYVKNSIPDFIKNPMASPEIEDDSPDLLEEYIMLGLRLCKGISLDMIGRLGGSSESVAQAFSPFLKAGLASGLGDNRALTPEGFLVSNGIIAKIIESASKK